MLLQLPKRIDRSQPLTLEVEGQLTIIGANGAGKTRFGRTLMHDCGNSFHISALKAVFPKPGYQAAYDTGDMAPGSIDKLFAESGGTQHFQAVEAPTEFDRLLYLLLHDEFIEMLRYKAEALSGGSPQVPSTKLDVTARRWEEVFPKNHLLRASGKLLFSNDAGDAPFNALRLSDGEKAVLYYIGAVQYAPQGAVIFVDDPETFLHHSIMQALWNVIESMRPDCTFVYNTHDIDFASSRVDNTCVWVRNFDAVEQAWDYEVIDAQSDIFCDQLVYELAGSRKPVLFVEGDEKHSIDNKLYPLIFSEYTVKPLGSCDKVIETTRAFNGLKSFHHLDSHGLVDRDRRDDKEVEYLRDKKVLVPNVAEIENIFMLEGVVRAVAAHNRRDPGTAFKAVRAAVIAMFKGELKSQALQHVRHRVKRKVETRIDRRFQNINALEAHMTDLVNEIDPRGMYEAICREFHNYVNACDYAAVLRVFNEKSMLSQSEVAKHCGLKNKDEYIRCVLKILRDNCPGANDIRAAVKLCFGITQQ